MEMLLTIILVNWNTKEELVGCLDSIAPEREKRETEIFVVDNGSQDGSPEAVREKYPWVHLLANEDNLGYARAVNMVLNQGRGRYLALINPDTRLKEGSLERLISFMETHPEAGVAGAQLLNGNGSRQNSIANFPSLATELLNKRLLRRLFPERYPGKERTYHEPVEVDSVIGACMMVRRNAVERVGLLDEGYFLFLEETDWCYRMKRAGWKVYHVPQAEIYHFQGKSARKDRKRAKLEYYRSRYYFFRKNRGRVQWVFLYAGLAIKLSLDLAISALTCVLTLFAVEKQRKRLLTRAYLMGWHLRGCPESMGLKPIR